MSTTYWALTGGLTIGIAVSALLLINGRITGVSGVLYNAFSRSYPFPAWQWLFIIGLMIGGYIAHDIIGFTVPTLAIDNNYLAIIGGLLVGFGTRLGNGCTSGHGICGNSRFSIRSIVSTCVFILFGMITVYVMRLL